MTNDAQTANAPLTVQEIAEIASRLAAATPGPWEVEAISVWRPNGRIQLKGTDAEFIAHAPADMRRLLAELQRAHDQLAEARDALRLHGRHSPYCAKGILYYTSGGEAKTMECGCGFDEVAAALKGDTP